MAVPKYKFELGACKKEFTGIDFFLTTNKDMSRYEFRYRIEAPYLLASDLKYHLKNFAFPDKYNCRVLSVAIEFYDDTGKYYEGTVWYSGDDDSNFVFSPGDVISKISALEISIFIRYANDTIIASAYWAQQVRTIILEVNRAVAFETREVLNNYPADLALSYEKEDDELFFRTKLSGPVKFLGADYDYIMAQDIESSLSLFITDLKTSALIFEGSFTRFDCQIDEFLHIIETDIEPKDGYNDILNNIDSEYDLIKEGVPISAVSYCRRAALQIYRFGSNRLTWYLGGMSWETDCEVVDNAETLTQTYYFATNVIVLEVVVKCAKFTSKSAFTYVFNWDYPTTVYPSSIDAHDAEGNVLHSVTGFGFLYQFEIHDSAGNVIAGIDDFDSLLNIANSGENDTVAWVTSNYAVRMLTAAATSPNGIPTYAIPSNDIVSYNRNYTRCIGIDMGVSSFLAISTLSASPTSWGLVAADNAKASGLKGKYYVGDFPPSSGLTGLDPISQSEWVWATTWFYPGYMWDNNYEPNQRVKRTVKDTFYIADVISTLLAKVAPNITHKATSEYSKFLYGNTGIFLYSMSLFIAPKSNILNGSYTQPAQKAPITLRQLFDMLKSVYNCYWYIDNENRLIIEHRAFFEWGLSYDPAEKQVVLDLTDKVDAFNRKSRIFAQEAYKFDKASLPGRYEYKWMDDSTLPFTGEAVMALSELVQKDKTEKINLDNFSADIDFGILNPEEFSKDGFFVLAPEGKYSGKTLTLPIRNISIGTKGQFIVQNIFAAFAFLQPNLLKYFMSAKELEINEVTQINQYLPKVKKQDLTVQVDENIWSIDYKGLVKTSLGNGVIEKLEVKLSTLTAEFTLCFEPY